MTEQKMPPTRQEITDTLVSVVKGKQKYIANSYYEELEDGLRKVMGGILKRIILLMTINIPKLPTAILINMKKLNG